MKYNCEKDGDNLCALADFLKIISEPSRLRIICLLEKKSEQCVCEIQDFLQLPQNLVSHHLKTLKDFGLLKTRKDGLKIYYSLDRGELAKHKKILDKIFKEEK